MSGVPLDDDWIDDLCDGDALPMEMDEDEDEFGRPAADTGRN